MPTTVGSFSAIDDTEVDAESPMTETLVTRLRDNEYWMEHKKTTSMDTTKYFRPDGSGGITLSTPTTIDGTKGTLSSITNSWATITSSTSGYLLLTYSCANSGSMDDFKVIVKLSDDTFTSSGITYKSGTGYLDATYSGTITTGQTVGDIHASVTAYTVDFRRSSGNLQYYTSAGSLSFKASWIII